MLFGFWIKRIEILAKNLKSQIKSLTKLVLILVLKISNFINFRL